MVTNAAVRPHQRYRLANGSPVPGVTTVLGIINKPALASWANRLGLQGTNSTEYVNDLAASGTLAHSLIESSLTGITAMIGDYSPEQIRRAQNALASFQTWARDKRLETRQTELSLVSEAHGYGGTLDWYGTVNGLPTLIDFKTSAAIYDDHLYQLAAYHQLLIEDGHEVSEARVLRLSRDEDAEFSEKVIPASGLAPYWQVCKAALALHRAIAATKPAKGRRW